MSRDSNSSETQMVLWFSALIIVLFVIPALYAANAETINGKLLALAELQLKVFVPFSVEAGRAWEHITNLEVKTLSWESMQAVLSYTGKWIRWPYAFLLVLLGVVSVFMGRTGGLVRRLNMETLLQNNAESFACLRPIVGRGKYLLSPESYDTGCWRIARTPVQFALEQGLLLDAQGIPFTVEQGLQKGLANTDLPAYGHALLDEKKTAIVLQKQLGAPFSGVAGLAQLHKALASAFMAYACGEKKDCIHILDTMSGSYTEKDSHSCPVLEQPEFQELLNRTLEKYSHILNSQLMGRHSAFLLPWFMALLTLARKKGVLATSQFLWLRPLDRPLWYALNQCGGRAAWAEGFAAWAHYAAEEKAGKSLTEAKTARAVTRLRETLAAQGWLAEGAHVSAPSPIVSAPVKEQPPKEGVVYAAAEVLDEDYDANESEDLKKEQF